MADAERDNDKEGFVSDLLREATTTGTGDDPPPPDEPQGAAMPRRGDGDVEDNRNTVDEERRER